jgi:uncharacterized protein (DUF1800 family)
MENTLVRRLAVQSGFQFDPSDCNFYSPQQEQWINKEIYSFAEAILNHCLDIAETHSSPKEIEAAIREKFGI